MASKKDFRVYRLYITVYLNGETYKCWIKDVQGEAAAKKFCKDAEWYPYENEVIQDISYEELF